VISNALRLNLFRLYDASRDRRISQVHTKAQTAGAPSAAGDETIKSENEKESSQMTKTMKIEGMMCGHCEARVKKALEALPEVAEAVVSHAAGTAIVTLSGEISDTALKEAVEAQDYQVTEIR
jgi:Cu2+-exporting ATPase